MPREGGSWSEGCPTNVLASATTGVLPSGYPEAPPGQPLIAHMRLQSQGFIPIRRAGQGGVITVKVAAAGVLNAKYVQFNKLNPAGPYGLFFKTCYIFFRN